jgi:hypothetical protein
VSRKAASASHTISYIHVSINSQVALKSVKMSLRNATVSSRRYTSGFTFQNYETPSILSGQNFGTSPFEHNQPVVLLAENFACSSTRWISDSAILFESSPASTKDVTSTILVGHESTMVVRSIVPIEVRFKNWPAVCSNDGLTTSSASYGLAPVILKSFAGRTVAVDHRSNAVPAFPAPLLISSPYMNAGSVRYVRFQGRSADGGLYLSIGGLYISFVSVMTAGGVSVSQKKRVFARGSINSSAVLINIEFAILPAHAMIIPEMPIHTEYFAAGLSMARFLVRVQEVRLGMKPNSIHVTFSPFINNYPDQTYARGVYDPLCWTHAATAVAPASTAPPGIPSASSLSMSDDSRYALAAQSLGLVFLSVLPLSQILLLSVSESSIYPVSLYIDDEFAEFTTSMRLGFKRFTWIWT